MKTMRLGGRRQVGGGDSGPETTPILPGWPKSRMENRDGRGGLVGTAGYC